jgi:hypothetical protein
MSTKISIGSGQSLKANHWLWCNHCERVFQARHMRPSCFGGNQMCPFCNAQGYDIDIFDWDDFYRETPDFFPDFPKSEAELFHGRHCPLVGKE